MTNNEVLVLNQNLKALKLPGAKFGYAIGRNVSILKPIVDSLMLVQATLPEYDVFERERIDLCEKLCEKDAKGRSKLVDKYYVFGANQAEFDKAYEELKEKYKVEIEARKKQLEDFNKLLDQPAEKIEFYKLKLADIPNEIHSDQMVNIFPIIEEDEKKK